MSRFVFLVALVLASLAAAPAAGADDALRFVRKGQLVKKMDRAAIEASCGARRVEVDDPYYGRRKSFLACPLRDLLVQGFGPEVLEARAANFFLRARDGYTKPADGARLLEAGGYLAFADAERADGSWEPIDRRQVDPGPFYLVWSEPGQNDLHRYPWPYQLVVIEMAPFEAEFPHTAPKGIAPDDPAWSGYAIFRRECVSCHAVNGEGGRVGPELNVPRSIVEYRPSEQIKAYVRDPQSFRYTTMPSHRHLSDAQLDALVAYFRAMSERKRDPGGGPASH
jgi:mono/diheme cytochrome c family protein